MKSVPGLRSLVVPSTRGLRFRIQSLWFRSRMLFTETTFVRRRTEMARKGQGIEILAGWQAGIGEEDFLRDLVQRTVQQVLEAEMTSFLGAGT